jgi:hypothetical protein
MQYIIGFLILTLGWINVAAQLQDKQYYKHLKKIEISRKKNKVIISNDTVFNHGQAYAVLKKIKKSPFVFDYVLSSLQGKELVYFKRESVNTQVTNDNGHTEKKYYFLVVFIQSGKTCELEINTSRLKNFIVENNLITNNELNNESEKKLLQIHGNTISAKYSQPCTTEENNYTSTVHITRNRHAPVYIKGDNIFQDNMLIAHYTKHHQIKNSNTTITLTFFDANTGNMIAQATISDKNARNWEIITHADRKKHQVKFYNGQDDKIIAEYLIDNFYF